MYKGRTAVERVNARLKIFWGVDDGNVTGSRRFVAQVGVVLAVHAAFATLLASAPRREGTLGKLRLGPIAAALRAQAQAASPAPELAVSEGSISAAKAAGPRSRCAPRGQNDHMPPLCSRIGAWRTRKKSPPTDCGDGCASNFKLQRNRFRLWNQAPRHRKRFVTIADPRPG